MAWIAPQYDRRKNKVIPGEAPVFQFTQSPHQRE
jgi:hypothetical protein